MTKIDTASNDTIIEMLNEESPCAVEELMAQLDADENTVAQIIRASAREGCLVWTKKHIVSTHSTHPFQYNF